MSIVRRTNALPSELSITVPLTDFGVEVERPLRPVKIVIEFTLKPLNNGEFDENQTKKYLAKVADVVDDAITRGICTDDFNVFDGTIKATLI
jgi:hypothetical protein